jgi:hypothetical protein
MYMTSPITIAPRAISAHPHHCNPLPPPDVCVPEVVAGVTFTVVVWFVTDVVLVLVTVFVFVGPVTVLVVVLADVFVVVVVVSVVATGSAVVRLLLTSVATLDAADLAC